VASNRTLKVDSSSRVHFEQINECSANPDDTENILEFENEPANKFGIKLLIWPHFEPIVFIKTANPDADPDDKSGRRPRIGINKPKKCSFQNHTNTVT
jgi:hypothetical protein